MELSKGFTSSLLKLMMGEVEQYPLYYLTAKGGRLMLGLGFKRISKSLKLLTLWEVFFRGPMDELLGLGRVWGKGQFSIEN